MTAPTSTERRAAPTRAAPSTSCPCPSTRAPSRPSCAPRPDWLAADRRAAFEAWDALPVESNQLYTPYIDLRGAQLEDAPCSRPTTARNEVWSRPPTTPTA